MKRFIFLYILLLGTIQVIAENYLAKGVFGQTDKTNKICSKTSGGLQISVPPGKEGNHCFYWFPKKKFSIPANTPIKVAAWIKTQNVIGVKNKKLQLGGRLTLSNQSKRYYMWMPGLRTENWKYVEKIAQWPVELNKCTQNLFIAYNCSGTVIYDDIYFGPYTTKDKIEEQRSIVSVISGTPKIDGILDDDIWKQSSPLTNFCVPNSKGNIITKDQTEIRFSADKSHLYIAIKAYSKLLLTKLQQVNKFKSQATKDGINVLRDDSIEMFFKKKDGSLLHLGCNSKGFKYTGNKNDKNLTIPWICKATTSDGFYVAEVAIPWSLLGYSFKEKKTILFNIGRNSHNDKGIFYSSLSPVEYRFNEEDNFGKLLFNEDIPYLQLPNLPLITQVGQLEAKIKIIANKPWQGKISLESKNKNEYVRSLEKILINKNKEITINLKSQFNAGISQQLRFVISNSSGKIVFRSPWRKIDCPASVTAINKISGAKLKVNGKIIPMGQKFFLKKGKNLLGLDKEKSNGVIVLPNDNPPITLKDKKSISLEVSTTKIKCLDVKNGLHIEKNATQVIPFFILEPQEKSLEIWVPSPIKIISHPKTSSTCITQKLVVYKKQNYIQHIIKLNAPKKAKSFTSSYLIKVPENCPNQLSPIRYRSLSKNGIELFQSLPLKIMPSFTGKSPKTIRLHMFDSWQYGNINEIEATSMLKTLANSGINVFCDRKSAFSKKNFPWVNAIRAANLKLNCELHNHAILKYIKKIEPLEGKIRPYLSCPVSYIIGKGKNDVIQKLKQFAIQTKPDEVCFDMECHPDIQFDTSKESLARFAKFAKLKNIPSKKDIKKGGKYRSLWIDFCCREIALYASILKEGIKAGHPTCKFMIYSSYQGEKNKEIYSTDWNYLGKVAEIGSCGYGYPSEEITKSTMKAALNTPFESGILIFEATHQAMVNLTNDIICRILQGYAGVMFYENAVIDGFYRKKIADAANLLSSYEEFFVKPNVSTNLTTSGTLLKQDAFILSRNNKMLLLYLNNTSIERRGIIKFANQTYSITVKPYAQYCQIIK